MKNTQPSAEVLDGLRDPLDHGFALKRDSVSIPYPFFCKKKEPFLMISPSSVIRLDSNFTGILEKIFPFDFWCLLVFSNSQFSSRLILVLKINN